MVLPRINNAAKNAPSWVVIIVLPNLQQVGHDLPYLQQVWFIYTKLAVSMAVQAILGVFPAALVAPAALAVLALPTALQSSTNTALVQAVFN